MGFEPTTFPPEFLEFAVSPQQSLTLGRSRSGLNESDGIRTNDFPTRVPSIRSEPTAVPDSG